MTSCQFCAEPVIGGATAHWMCGGILPDDLRERPIAVADHIVRMLEHRNRQGGQMKRRPWTRDQLLARTRDELTDYFDRGLALALGVGKVRWTKDGLTLAPARAAAHRRRECAPTEALFEIPT
jgi:hypothetical protein